MCEKCKAKNVVKAKKMFLGFMRGVNIEEVDSIQRFLSALPTVRLELNELATMFDMWCVEEVTGAAFYAPIHNSSMEYMLYEYMRERISKEKFREFIVTEALKQGVGNSRVRIISGSDLSGEEGEGDGISIGAAILKGIMSALEVEDNLSIDKEVPSPTTRKKVKA